MNYRHSFHAGNHTEVFKHAVLVHLLSRLREKEKPFFVLDTHSGAGIYDLESDAARRTGEARSGIVRAQDSLATTLLPYLAIVRQFNKGPLRYYPGSAALIASMLRSGDRAVMCEFSYESFSSLRRQLAGQRGVTTQHRDGYQAMVALVPPPERRGLIFVDPPYEQKDEVKAIADHLIPAFRKWTTGTFACWYPVKGPGIARSIKGIAAEHLLPKSLTVQFLAQKLSDDALCGSGMLIVNVPWKFDVLLRALCDDLAEVFGSQSSWAIEWISEPT